VYGKLAELARRRHRKTVGKTSTASGKALLANLRASSLGERRNSDHDISTSWEKVIVLFHLPQRTNAANATDATQK